MDVKLQFTPSGAEVTIKQSGWKSSESDAEKIKKDFEELISDHEQAERKMSENMGLYLTDKKIFLKDNKIHTEYRGLASMHSVQNQMNLKESNEEWILVQPLAAGVKVESNGKILRTDKNAVLAWPKDAATLTLAIIDENTIRRKDNLLDLYKSWEKK